ncbi:hypothetical protein [Brevibacillus nitrificans]|nr:hypothetical protein [Brevibacillus nitrificans]
METSERQVPKTVDIFKSSGFIPQVATDPELDATIVIGIRP